MTTGGGTSGSGKPGGMGSMGSKRVIVIAVVAVAALAYAWYLRSTLAKPAGTEQPSASGSPTALGDGEPTPEPIPTPEPLTQDEKQTVGNITVMAKAGMLARENESLKQLFSQGGIDLVASKSIGNMILEEITAKIRSQELTPQEAAAKYWRLDILEVRNPDELELTAWVEKFLPVPEETDTTKLVKGNRTLGGKVANTYTLTNTEIGLVQTIFFLQPEAKGNVMILSSFQGTALPFQQQLEGLLKSVEFVS